MDNSIDDSYDEWRREREGEIIQTINELVKTHSVDVIRGAIESWSVTTAYAGGINAADLFEELIVPEYED